MLEPVVSEGLVVLRVERAGRGKHDGGVQVCDDARHRAGRCDTGLRALVACLEGREHQGHLNTQTHRWRRAGFSTSCFKKMMFY